MVPQFSIIVLYATGILELLLPLLLLFFLKRRHDYAFSSVICGLAAYFIVNYLVINNIYTIVRVATGNESIFLEKVWLGLILEAVLAALILPPLAHFIIKNLRRGKWSLYDTIAMGIGYWALPLILDSALQVSSGSILQKANQGGLDALVTEDYPIELFNALVDSITSESPFMLAAERVITLITQLIVLLCILSVLMLVFYAVKRNRKVCLWLAMLVYLMVILLINGSNHYLGYWPSLIVVAILGAAAVYFVYRFLRYYRSQQIELLKKRKEYKELQHEKYLQELEAKKQQGRS
ncbi:MAG: YhfC family intramembrane metalloprotease [Clostridiales bacterium]|nr:YhfC family intramembrane metalloprotease [Clostridiales bacterium]